MQVIFIGMAFGGDAIARHEGKTVFVPLAMPGDEAEIEIVENRPRFARGRIARLIEPAPARVAPLCKHFGVCGGCHYQHIPYELQLAYKTQIVREQLMRIGGLSDPLVHPTIGADNPWHYRNHIQFHVGAEGRLGFMAAKTNEVVPIEECHLLSPPLESLWRELEFELPDLEEVILRASVRTGERLVALRLNSAEALEAEIDLPVNCVLLPADGSQIVLSGDDHLHEVLQDRVFRIAAESFFQVNTPQAEQLAALVVKYALGQSPTSGSPRSDAAASLKVLDAYCGVGVFALALAPHVARVIGIESAPRTVQDARANAQGFANVEILEGRVETLLPTLDGSFDLIVLDPPREGCDPRVLDAIAERSVPRIVYVSCDPSTLARDVKRLANKGYRFVEAQPLDMFPQTYHIETVAVLDKP